MQHTAASQKTSVRLLNEIALIPVVTSLVFTPKAQERDYSNEVLQLNRLRNADSTIRPYARTAQYADSLTTYFPALIS